MLVALEMSVLVSMFRTKLQQSKLSKAALRHFAMICFSQEVSASVLEPLVFRAKTTYLELQVRGSLGAGASSASARWAGQGRSFQVLTVSEALRPGLFFLPALYTARTTDTSYPVVPPHAAHGTYRHASLALTLPGA